MEETNFKWKPVVFAGVKAFKMSIFRAFRRGHVDMTGMPVSRRLFHNRKNTCKRKGRSSRAMNDLKRKAYDDYRKAKVTRGV